MTPEIKVRREVPSSIATKPATLSTVSKRAGMQAGATDDVLERLAAQDLVQPYGPLHDRSWSRTPKGDRVARGEVG